MGSKNLKNTRAGKRTGSNKTERPVSAARRRYLNARVKEMVRQMRNTPAAVSVALKLGKKWRGGLPGIAGAAFSDAFAGFCAVYLVKNGKSHIGHLQKAFLGSMRRELESREAAERGRK